MPATLRQPRPSHPWGQWLRDAALEWSWGHTTMAAALALLSLVYWHNLFFPETDGGLHLGRWLLYYVCQFAVPLVYALRVADRAADDGIHPVLAYGIAITAALTVGSCLRYGIVRPLLEDTSPWSLAGIMTRITGWYVPACIGVAAYAKWRQREKILARLRLSEIQHVRQQQELQSAHLMALQARVEPALLFETLQRVDVLIGESAPAADVLLVDTIEMLRAMLPQAGASSSTVEREFALVQAYARVTGAPSLQAPLLTLEAAPGAAGAAFAPMVLLPLLRTLSADAQLAWHVHAECRNERLHLSCTPSDSGAGHAARTAVLAVDEQALRERLSAVHGADATVHIESGERAGVAIELPCRYHPQPHISNKS